MRMPRIVECDCGEQFDLDRTSPCEKCKSCYCEKCCAEGVCKNCKRPKPKTLNEILEQYDARFLKVGHEYLLNSRDKDIGIKMAVDLKAFLIQAIKDAFEAVRSPITGLDGNECDGYSIAWNEYDGNCQKFFNSPDHE